MATRKDPANSKPKTGAEKSAAGKKKNLNGGNPQKTHGRDAAIQGIKEDLARQREVIIGEAEVAINALPEQTVFPDLGDQASAEIDRNFMLRLRGREQRLLKKIEEAIERIEAGSFGICESCGEPIDIKRLCARPVTTMCIECKTEQEEEEKLQGNH